MEADAALGVDDLVDPGLEVRRDLVELLLRDLAGVELRLKIGRDGGYESRT